MKNVKQVISAALAILLMLVITLPVKAAQTNSRTKTVRVGWYLPTDKHSDNPFAGFDYEYLMAISQYTGWEYEFVDRSLEDCLKLLADGEIDILCKMNKTADREAKYAFSSLAAGTDYQRMLTTADSALTYEDYEGFNGIKVGLLSGSSGSTSFDEFTIEHGFTPQIVRFEDYDDMNDALRDGSIDALIEGTHSQQIGLQIISKFSFKDFFFMTAIDNEELISELNTAVERIHDYDPNFSSELYEKHLLKVVDLSYAYNKEEKDFIARNPEVTVLIGENWYPMEYFDNETGRFGGIIPDLMELISNKSGINFTYRQIKSCEELYQTLHSDTQTITSLSFNYNWAKDHNANITLPFIEAGVMRVSRQDAKQYKTVAVQNGYFLSTFTEKQTINRLEFDTVEECMQAVFSGKADFTYINEYQARYYASFGKYSHLNFAAMPGVTHELSLAVSNYADPLLYEIISKTLGGISSTSINTIITSNTTQAAQTKVTDFIYANPLLSIGVTALFFGVIIFIGILLFRYRTQKTYSLMMEQVSNAKSDFVSRMSHDMRTPMNAIIGLSDIGMTHSISQNEQEDYMKKINYSARYLLGIINDVLDISKIENKKIVLHQQPVEVKEIFEEVYTILEPEFKKKNIHYIFESHGYHEKYAMLDKLRVKQILMNILSNAVKFTPEGGAVECVITSLEHNNNLCMEQIVIRDTGIGMSEKFLPRVFLPFEQDENQNRVAYGGTGLGMPIVKSLVELMGGTISVKSRLGEGTEFTVILEYETMQEIKTDGEEAQTEAAALDLTDKVILLCEDHPLNIMVAEKLLTSKGAKVAVAENGAVALKMLTESTQGTFAAILMDIRMPVMDGLEAARRIRGSEHPDAKLIPIIAMTANAFYEDVTSSIAAGMNAHLSKPIKPQALYAVLNRFIYPRSDDTASS